jgi:hypothetical protein
MTTLTWSNEQIQSEFAECENLEQVISSVENRVWTNGEVVCEIFVNGFSLNEEDETRFSSSALADIKELKIQSNRPDELVRETLGSISTYIPELSKETDELANRYRDIHGPGVKNQEQVDQEVTNVLYNVLEGFRWLTDAIFLIRTQLENWAEVGDLVDDWKELEEKHTKALKELISAFDQQDQTLIADVLEYDVADVLEDWRRIIPQVLAILNSDTLIQNVRKSPCP